MKQKIYIPLFILLIGLSAFAQTNEKLNCPTINIIPPPAAVQPGENMLFSVSIDRDDSNLKFAWSVDQGTIVEGQGTKVILVSTERLEDTTVEVTVIVKGVPDNCNNKFSEYGVVSGGPEPCEYINDEFGNLANDDIRARLDNLFIHIQSEPSYTGYVENWGPKKDIFRREKLIRQHIRDRKYDPSRIVLVNSGEEKEIRTKVWTFPAGFDVSRCIKSLAKTKDEK